RRRGPFTMTDPARDGALPPATPSRGGPAVVVHKQVLASETEQHDWRQLVPAWITSGVIHVVLLSLFLLVHGPVGADSTLEQTVVETKVDEDANKEYNLENTDIGNNPDLPTNYDLPRIEDISVPGPVNASEQVGILNADPNATPQTVPPPPGLGDNTGQGGGADMNFFGRGNAIGFPGGMGGPLMKPGGFGG